MVSTDLISDGEKEFQKEFLGAQRKVLLAGGGGYIGLAIANKLLSQNYEVIVLDNYIYNHEIASLSFPRHKNLEFVTHDLRDPVPEKYMLGVTDVVILAGLVGDPITKSYPVVSDQINGTGIRLFIKNLNKYKLNKVIFISTCSNYGMIEEKDLADENFELNPLSLYAKEKVINEEFILSLEDINYSPTVLRFATAFGAAARMRFDLTVNEFVLNIFRKESLDVYDADTWRPYCHVEDFGNLIYVALASPKYLTDCEIFNAGGSENNHTKRSLIEIIGNYLSLENVQFVSGGTDPRNYRVDFSKVKNTLQFTPSWNVELGIKEIINNLESGAYEDCFSNKNFYGNYEIDKKFIRDG